LQDMLERADGYATEELAYVALVESLNTFVEELQVFQEAFEQMNTTEVFDA
jgi:hypothetical protein